MNKQIVYTPTPTIQRYMLDNSLVRLIMGPVGSGKTSGSIMEILRRCSQQPKSKVDGLRYSRWAIIRNTTPQLRDTTIKSFLYWVPDGVIGTWRTTEKVFHLQFNDVRAEIMFRALDGPQDIGNLLSLELTGAYLNEFREIHPEIVNPLLGRLGRYPAQKSTEEPYWYGLIGDTNPPNIESWWWAMMEGLDPEDRNHKEKPNGWRVFKQPSGRSPTAENVENLPTGYYSTEGKSEEYVRVYIDGDYGRSNDGFPVYDKVFVPSLHVSDTPLTPVRSSTYPVIVGLDFGRTPAAVLCQYDYRGRLIIFDEIISQNMGIETFCRNLLLPKLQEKEYTGLPVIVVGDPAGQQKSQINEESPFDVLKRMGFREVRPALSNKPERRQGAMEALLLQQEEGKGRVIIDKKAKMLINGLSFGYIYGQTKGGELRQVGERSRPQVVKNMYSHICEATEYVALDNKSVGGIGLPVRRNYKISPPASHRWLV